MPMSEFFILVGEKPVRVDDVLDWARWLEAADNEGRRVALAEFDGVMVSTVFLGINHRFLSDGPPLIFETMVFGGAPEDRVQRRYSTWEEAERGHEEIVKLIKCSLTAGC